MKTPPPPTDLLSSLGAFSDPVRRQLYDYVVSRQEPVTRAEAATATGISRSLAAYHLDQLADAGFLTFRYARSEGQGGPGAGRPAKRYARAEEEVSISMPPRSYGLLASILAEAMKADESGAVRIQLNRLAAEEGRKAATQTSDQMEELVALGYEPSVTEEGDIVMNNCPFHHIQQQEPELVCTLNHHLLRGYLDARREDPDRAILSPCEGRCCVIIHPPEKKEAASDQGGET